MKKLPVLLLLLFLSLSRPLSAALLVSESFDYALAEGASMGGAATNATGLGGNYTLTTSTLSGTQATVTYMGNGLAFGPNYTATAGAVRFSTTSASNGNGGSAILAASLTGSASGTLWSSYLVSFSSRINNSTASATSRISNSATSGAAAYFVAAADSSVVQDRPGITYETGTQVNSAFTTALNTTYLIISRYNNVGTALGGPTGTANLWIFTQTGFNNWVADGSNELNLGSFSSGSATDTAGSGTFLFDDTRFVQFSMFAGSNALLGTFTATYDELRYATTLGEALVVVPEPDVGGTLALSAALAAACGRARRRRH